MTADSATSRRTFVRNLAASAIVGSGLIFTYRALNREEKVSQLHALVDWLRRNGGPGVDLGKKYLRDNPSKADLDQLHAAILGRTVLVHEDEISSFLRTKISSDYLAGRTVLVDQWMFSKTELQLSAFQLLGPRYP
jgi:hypothetical protein